MSSQIEQPPEVDGTSPPWSATTKAIVAVTALVLTGLILWVFRGLLQQLVLAGLLAYVLHPLITLVDERTPLKRGQVVLLVYGTLALLVLATLSLIGVTTFQQAVELYRRLPGWFEQAVSLVETLPERLPDTLSLGPLAIPTDRLIPQLPGWEELVTQALSLLQPIFSRGGSLAAGVVGATVSVVGQIFLVFVISIYIANDIPRFGSLISDLAQQPGYRADAERLMARISQVWAAYLRGQVILALIIFVFVSMVLGGLRVDNALGLGLLSGAMEFLPIIGPLIGAGAAILVALFQSPTPFGLSPWEYALMVTIAMALIQQIENNLLVPRIVGQALDLHPLLVMVSVIMGASLAGLLGAVLAAPVVASLKILGVYAWRKMLDLPPFPASGGQDDKVLETQGDRETRRQGDGGTTGPVNQSSSQPISQSPISNTHEPIFNPQSSRGTTMTDLYPLLFEPVYKDYIWGGRNLERVLGRALPPGIIAESWEIAAHPNGQSTVANGPLAGKTLAQLQEMLGERLVGSNSRRALDLGKFPLLIKLLDANRWLSVQVHPDDDYALAHEGEFGKTEMWVVLHAEPGAELIYGLRRGADRAAFTQAVAEGRVEELLHRIPVQAGDVIFVPAGAVHALGPGIIVAEIQQNSDTTYRIYDWGRLGHDGKPRPLHVESALEVIDWTLVEPQASRPTPLPGDGPGVAREELARCAYFLTQRLRLEPGAVLQDRCAGDTFQIWGVLDGAVDISWSGGEERLTAVAWTLLPADLGPFQITAQAESTLL
ncbi:MAG: AI-2E family transporter, partial [Caldilineae bacterium]